MFFNGWYDLIRILIVGVCAYTGLILILRTTGKRTLSKMNAFDLIITVSLGSTLATVLLNSNISLSEGLFALTLLCLLQYGVAFVSTRSNRFQNLIKAEPTLLFFRGTFLSEMLRQERVTQEEIFAAVRAQGITNLAVVEAVVLETDGSFSVVSTATDQTIDTLRYVGGANKQTL